MNDTLMGIRGSSSFIRLIPPERGYATIITPEQDATESEFVKVAEFHEILHPTSSSGRIDRPWDVHCTSRGTVGQSGLELIHHEGRRVFNACSLFLLNEYRFLLFLLPLSWKHGHVHPIAVVTFETNRRWQAGAGKMIDGGKSCAHSCITIYYL